ncbi:GNAT family N-acetyltransferase [Dechloromonas sp. HYN0024]|uniref:GNAT family N-acetyltransferase n=1 Tax=Dechloromonas sp. HYN0024 TaxID=2231055 RepID=UPI0013C3153E|nr:GNAT family N-acetyltransferase [Dechloromonas sp. HYN0024]
MDTFRIDTLDTSSPPLLAASVTLIVNAFADPERYSAERVRRELRGDDPAFYRRFFVALEAGEIVAVGGVKAADWASKTHLLYLSAVTPERRGKGIGRAMIKARLDWLEANFKTGRILVSATKTKRFRDLGFVDVRNSNIDGRHLLVRRF